MGGIGKEGEMPSGRSCALPSLSAQVLQQARSAGQTLPLGAERPLGRGGRASLGAGGRGRSMYRGDCGEVTLGP